MLLERLAVYTMIIPLILFLLPIFYDPKEAHRSLTIEKISLSSKIRKYIMKKIERSKRVVNDHIDQNSHEPRIYISIEKQNFVPIII